MKLVFLYLEPTEKLRGLTLEMLPRATVAVYANDGYVSLAWLLWACELQWKYAT